MKVRKAIIPAAGLGTRFLPATKAQPKEMLPIVDKPTIQYIIEEAVASGIEDIIIVTGRNKRSIEDHFDKSIELELELERGGKQELLEMVRDISDMADIHYIRQKEPRGLGHAILTAKHFVGNEPFAVLLGDDVVVARKPCLAQMIEVYGEYKTSVLGVQRVPHEVVNKYGIVDCKGIDDRVYKVRDLVEKPRVEDAPSDIAILGRYIITPTIFSYLETQDAGTGGEIQLTDALKRMACDEAMYAYDFKGHRYDVGTKCGFLQANIEFSLRNPETRDEMLSYIGKLNENMDAMLDYE
ncbi:MAG: UTP--glucose-1-phosphate uridylyltransferase GalU [Lachnospiraceae bacterium]|nr:UTP--glucose-1-phosphate uridylyltransferase GalU [Lachnospiraceae bacterium]